MADKLSRTGWIGVASLTGLSLLGCTRSRTDEPSASRPTQGAVSTAVERVSQSVASAIDPRAVSSDRAGGALPDMRVSDTGLEVRSDDEHQSATKVRTPDGWAVTWGDREHTSARFVRMNDAGRPISQPVVVYQSRTDLEDVWSPAVAHTGRDFGVAWSDPANGRVRFARLDAQGRRIGRTTIVHDGLEMPLMTRVVWNGREFGVAVGMHSGVYFARVDARGERIGDGIVIAEGTAVASLEDLSAGPNGFQVSWRDGDERGTQHQVRVSRNGQLVEPSGSRSSAAVGRVALR